MSRPNSLTESTKSPHPISLKVLRLSKPALSVQCPLPEQEPDVNNRIDRRSALSCPLSNENDNLFLSPLLSLPSSFGTVYVGETLSATICANNELSVESINSLSVENVRLTAEIQIPSQRDVIPLDLESSAEGTTDSGSSLPPGNTLQKVLRFALREEGNHVLAVTVTYNEKYAAGDKQTPQPGGRERTLRKLYQFAAQQLLSVRSKTRVLPFGNRGHVLEAQLENLGGQAIRLEYIGVHPKAPFASRSLNAWDLGGKENPQVSPPSLQPGNILQTAFLIEPDGSEGESENSDTVALGQLSIHWRGAMGEKGSLNTGLLMAKRN